MKNVLLVDSGSGGVNILKECICVAPNCNYLLFCDDKNLPYGSKTKEELQKITLENLKKLYDFFKFDIVVLACNTLTSTCLEKCREVFSEIVFVGTVPAIKPALLEFEPEEILVLATEVTIKHNVSINKVAGLQLKSMPTLAQMIDENLDYLEEIKPFLETELRLYKFKAIVLGCTHYLSIKDLLLEIFGDEVKIFDSANGVARRLKTFVPEERHYQVQIMVSQNQDFIGKLWWYFNK